jgi:hypothetical protein
MQFDGVPAITNLLFNRSIVNYQKGVQGSNQAKGFTFIPY